MFGMRFYTHNIICLKKTCFLIQSQTFKKASYCKPMMPKSAYEVYQLNSHSPTLVLKINQYAHWESMNFQPSSWSSNQRANDEVCGNIVVPVCCLALPIDLVPHKQGRANMWSSQNAFHLWVLQKTNGNCFTVVPMLVPLLLSCVIHSKGLARLHSFSKLSAETKSHTSTIFSMINF